MATIFLDANVFLDVARKRTALTLQDFGDQILVISPLSIHIFFYLYKGKVPDLKIVDLCERFIFSPFSAAINHSAMEGPTADFEDNVQLHSAAAADCTLFLTRDKKLLATEYFGSMRIGSKP